MSKTLLLLEGGAYRGIFTAGVLDVFLREGLHFDAVAGISAGSLCAYNFISRDLGRTKRILLEYGNDPRYFSARNLLHTGHSVGDDFLFFTLMELIPFGLTAFRNSPTVFAVGATNCRSGEIVYFEKGKARNLNDCILASCSLPLSGKMVWIDGDPYLDGGVAEHAPLTYMAQHPEYDKVVLVLTRPLNARKLPISQPQRRALHAVYHRNKVLYPLLLQEPDLFNEQRAQISKMARDGQLFVIGPDKQFRVKRVERDTAILQEGYDQGVHAAEANLPAMLEYLAGN
ncbi:MAG: patatin family protein [Candidatus Avoscillospira sp.]